VIEAKAKLSVLRDEWTGCRRCVLSELRSSPRICFGAGSFDADIFLLFDSPAEEDMRAGRPGATDEIHYLLDHLHKAGGLDPKRTFRASVVACRPYVVIPATEENEEHIQERKPDREEIQACQPRLHETIYLVDPRIIVAMGELSWKAVVTTRDRGRDNTIAKAAKKLYVTHISGRTTTITYPVMATVSPQQMLANPSAAKHGPTAATAQALRRAVKYVEWLKRHEETT
jgi:DNA polymerase